MKPNQTFGLSGNDIARLFSNAGALVNFGRQHPLLMKLVTNSPEGVNATYRGEARMKAVGIAAINVAKALRQLDEALQAVPAATVVVPPPPLPGLPILTALPPPTAVGGPLVVAGGSQQQAQQTPGRKSPLIAALSEALAKGSADLCADIAPILHTYKLVAKAFLVWLPRAIIYAGLMSGLLLLGMGVARPKLVTRALLWMASSLPSFIAWAFGQMADEFVEAAFPAVHVDNAKGDYRGDVVCPPCPETFVNTTGGQRPVVVLSPPPPHNNLLATLGTWVSAFASLILIGRARQA